MRVFYSHRIWRLTMLLVMVLSVSLLLQPVAAVSDSPETVPDLAQMISGIKDGETLHLDGPVVMTDHVCLDHSITITGIDNLERNGYAFYLSAPGVTLCTDSELNVGSGVDGYLAVRTEDTYSLVEISHPMTVMPVPGSTAERVEDTRYLFLDLNPTTGMTMQALKNCLIYPELMDFTLTYFIEGNDGSGVVKTADRLAISVYNADNVCIAQVTEVIIVMGDTNCNGKVSSSDAAILMDISSGADYPEEVRLAADANRNGTTRNPKVNSSDAAYMMDKWFVWDTGKYVSNLK